MLECYEMDKSMTKPIVSESINSQLLKVALKVCKKRTRELDDLIDDPNGFENLVSDAEWRILAQNEMTEEDLQQKKHSDWIKKNDMKNNPKTKNKKKKRPATRKQTAPKEEEKEEEDYYEYDEEDDGEEEKEENEAAK